MYTVASPVTLILWEGQGRIQPKIWLVLMITLKNFDRRFAARKIF